MMHFLRDEMFHYNKKTNFLAVMQKWGTFLPSLRLPGGDDVFHLVDKLSSENDAPQELCYLSFQREQSLFEEKGTPSQYRQDWALGYGALSLADGGEKKKLSKWQGMENQIRGMIPRSRTLFNEWKKGMRLEIDNKVICVPHNAFSWMQLRYTPHFMVLDDNYKLWAKYFSESI